MPAPHVQAVGFSDDPFFTAQTLVALPDSQRTAGASLTFDTSEITYAALDITLTSFTGGTTPSATFTLARQGADGVFYTVWTSTPQTGAITYSIDLSPSVTYQTTGNPNAPDAAVHCVFTALARFTYAFAGSPTSVRFSASLVGR